MGSDPVKVSRLRRQSSAATPTNADTSTSSGPSTSIDSSNSQSMPSTTDFSTSPSLSPAASPTSPSDSSSPLGSSSSQADSSSSFSMPSSDSTSSGTSSSQSPSSSTIDSTALSTSSSLTTPTESTSTGSTSSPSSLTTGSSTSSSTSDSTTNSTSTTDTLSPSTTTSTSTSLSSSTTTSTPASTSTATSSSSSEQPTSMGSTSTNLDATASLTTITTSILTTIDGQLTTIVSAIPSSLNSAPSVGAPGHRGGIIAGSAIGASLFALLALTGMVVYYRRRSKRRQLHLAYRSLPRSALLDDEDAFDLADAPSRLSAAPKLLRPRGLETGSIFHEGVWPPPGERSRLEDPLRAGSTIALTSIVDDVMGGGHDQPRRSVMGGHDVEHGRSISTDTTRSDIPLLANMSPERGGDASPSYAATPWASSHEPSRPAPTPQSPLAIMSDPSEAIPSEHHDGQLSDDAPAPRFSPPESHATSPSAAAPVVRRGQSGRSAISTTGSLSSDFPFGFGSLVVVNDTSLETDYPLVDLMPIAEDPPHEIPPLYHTIQSDAPDT